MIKRQLFASLCILFFICHSAHAIGWPALLRAMEQIEGTNIDIKNINSNVLDVNKDQLTQLNAIMSGLSGTHHYGSIDYDSQQYAWGKGADDWQVLLSLYKAGGGGELANVAGQLSHDFPISENLDTGNPEENEYYRLQAQTTLASRATSQLAFNQVSKEPQVVAALHDQIDQAKDIKSSADLNNRMLSEQNSMSIQQTKLLAALLQQAAIGPQERADHAKEDAAFFDYKK